MGTHNQKKVAVPAVDLTAHTPHQVFLKCENWRVEEKDYTMDKKIGEGAYGVVWRCNLRGETCAAKMLKKNVVNMRRASIAAMQQTNPQGPGDVKWQTVDEYKSDIAYKDLIMELDVLLTLDAHPNLVGFKGACVTDENNPIIFEEFVHGPSLKDFMLEAITTTGTWFKPTRTVAYYWVQDLLRGVEYLHNRDPVIIHRDLKPGNIMLSKDLCCLKIGDFGMCKMVKRGERGTHTGHCGTVAYMAPEMYNKAKLEYDEKVDIYSTSIIMWNIATGQGRALAAGSNYSVEMRPDISLVEWPPMETLIQRAWDGNPSARPSATELLADLKRFPEIPEPLTPLQFKKAGCGSGCSLQ